MRYRYGTRYVSELMFVKVLIALTFKTLVPVVGLEPTRLFKVPGF
jgi:hypothetical protein